MDGRKLARRRLTYLFPLRNKHPEYRREVRRLLRWLNPRMPRSERLSYEASRRSAVSMMQVAAMAGALSVGR